MRVCGSLASLPVMGAAVFVGLLGGDAPNSLFSAHEAGNTPFLLPVAGEGQSELGKYAGIAKNEAVTTFISTPIELFWKDIWEQTFHKSGKPMWDSFFFKLKGLLRYRAAHKATIVVIWELKRFLYGDDKVNTEAWAKLEKKLEGYLREWWVTVPEDPWAELHTGVWKALLKLYNEDLEPLMRGSPKLKELEKILFDSQLTTIRQWTDMDHINVMRGSSSAMLPRLQSLRETKGKKILRSGSGNQ
ncbi:putative dense-granule antigen DG32 [Neospora caninum Liverpool]|uniref:Dense-granule antigen DG32, putative n=1 Tax=Neospora caninum (strain Liverpool) TaxID=572307 RepID=F0V8N9_NEOCL|nr:putative dense-granule antigen DG32 [Neospora caninum Liverpool]CBZ50080.1 putative dense-granule antigen DG32 [Neospora caninum Liverpool]CEL64675.1 TPA: dense-granule antigen DG32, putative [Neospora caninum Liverpool]|eukprot:XP_003880115.1 putative dense-granule antigen DG32 [Neospora caninum Liverpool]